jgi:hypothetical protein
MSYFIALALEHGYPIIQLYIIGKHLGYPKVFPAALVEEQL